MITLKKTKVSSQKLGLSGYRLAVKNHGTLGLDDLCSLITINNTITRTDVVSVISALAHIVESDLKQGYSVCLGDLGTFQLRVTGTGADSKKGYSTENITATRVRFVPSKKLKRTISKGANGIFLRMA